MSSEKNSTRIRILKSAWKLLEDGGGGSVRMSDIAKSAKISRQALYLHFPNRADLLVATTAYLDEVYDIENKLVASRTAENGLDRLNAWIEVWGNYIPKIYGIAKALLAMKDSDEEAMTAWNDRMYAVRHGCDAAVEAIYQDGKLNKTLNRDEATDLLWTQLSVRTWEHFRFECGWSQERYIRLMKVMAESILVAD
jgi:AcrR family transcriptional regulator